MELVYTDGTVVAIDVNAVENESAEDMYQRAELDRLIFNDPLAYADLVMTGNANNILNRVTRYKPLDQQE